MFLSYGFKILQNNEDIMTMDDKRKEKFDQFLDKTKDETSALIKASMHNKEDDIDKINDILDFCKKERYVFFTLQIFIFH